MTLIIKPGETFLLLGQYVDDDGTTPKSLTGVTLTSQLRDKKNALIATLTINIINSTLGLYAITASLGTSSWPKNAVLYMDIMENLLGNIVITDTIKIQTLETITQI